MIGYFIFYYGLYFGLLFLLDNIWFKLIGFNAMFYIGNLILLWRLYKREKNVKSYLIEITNEQFMKINQVVKTPLQNEMIGYNLYNICIVCLGAVHYIFYLKLEMTDLLFFCWMGLYIFFTGLIYYYLIRYRMYLREIINRRFVLFQV